MNAQRTMDRVVLAVVTICVLVFAPLTCLAQNSQSAPDEASFEDMRKEMRELAETMGKYGAQQRDKAVEQARPALEALDRRLEALEDSVQKNWDAMSESAKEQTQRALRELRRQRVKLAEMYGNLKSSSESAWEQMKKGFLDAYEVLNEAWEESVREFRQERRD